MDPQIFIDAARYAHILTVAIGFGAAFLADFHVVARLGRPIDDELTTTLHLCHSVIWKMVIGMWVTGLILVQIRTGFVLENFTPKLISKLVTVAILTANAFLISKIAMPLVEENRGRSLMWLPLSSKLCLAGIGAISSASWMLALAMGSSKVLAGSGWVVFAVLMPFIYFAGVSLAVAVMYLLHLGSQMVAQQPKTREMLVAPTTATIVNIAHAKSHETVSNPAERLAAQSSAQDRTLAPAAALEPNETTKTAEQGRPTMGIPEERRIAINLAAERSVATNIPAQRHALNNASAAPRMAAPIAAE